LVEIGGSFRLPDIMEASGALLREVGTTNRTRLKDYEKALQKKTALLLKVHPSNYQIQGFVEEVVLKNLVTLGHKHRLPVMIDLGSGSLMDVQNILDTGVDLVAFSGDKLLGGPQAGILLGKKEIIQKLRDDPWLRIVRVDKMTLGLLEKVIRDFGKSPSTVEKMMQKSVEELRETAKNLVKKLNPQNPSFSVRVADTDSTVGGGSLPGQLLSSAGVSVRGKEESIRELEHELRIGEIPVIGRIKKGELILDLRTVFPEEVDVLAKAVLSAMVKGGKSA